MQIKQTLITATLFTLITAVVLGLGYPLLMLAIAHTFFRTQADGQLILDHGGLAGSRLIGQPFTGPRYFHSRPSAAGAGYDAANSSGSNLGPTSKALVDRVNAASAAERTASPVPIDLVTTSGSGLDPDITVAAADYQSARVAKERGLTEVAVQQLVVRDTVPRQFGFLGEARVPVLLLNRDLDVLAKGQGH
jgi:K+-transporting ATPase ATPase C chain